MLRTPRALDWAMLGAVSCAVLFASTARAAGSRQSTGVNVSSLTRLLFEPAPTDDLSAHNKCQPWAVPRADRCHYVHTHIDACEETGVLVPYLNLYYCVLPWRWLGNVLLAAWIVFLVLLLSLVADRFFCPALAVISDFLQLPGNVAGATLLSFGNGAPDLFTQLAAVSQLDASSVPIALGEPLGSGLFVSNVVLAASVLASVWADKKPVAIQKRAFYRDAGFYTGAIVMLVIFTWDGRLTLLKAVALLVYYIVFVAYVLIFDRKASEAVHIEDSRKYRVYYRFLDAAPPPRPHQSTPADFVFPKDPAGSSSQGSVPAPMTGRCATVGNDILETGGAATIVPLLRSVKRDQTNTQVLLGNEARTGEEDDASRRFMRHAPTDLLDDNTRRFKAFLARTRVPERFGSSSDVEANIRRPVSDPFEPVLRSHDESHATVSSNAYSADIGTLDAGAAEPHTLLSVMQTPIVWLLRLTMPEVGMDDNVVYPRPFAVMLPITAPLFVVLAKGMALRSRSPLGVDSIIYGLTCSILASAVIYAIYPKSGRHYGVLSGLFTVMTFGMCILWMNIAASELVRTWKSIGHILGLKQGMLGVTVLAWMNGVGDLVADVSLARDGFPSMAVSAVFATPLFVATGSLGLSFTIAMLRYGSLDFSVKAPLKTTLIFALVSIAGQLVVMPTVFKWKMTCVAAASLIVFYAVFQCVYLTETLAES